MQRRHLFWMAAIMLLMLCLSIVTPQQAYSAPMTTMEAPISVSVRELSLKGGPMQQTALLSPGGTQFLHHLNRELCVYTILEEQKFCVAYGASHLRPDLESFVWSPDERYIVFASDFFLSFQRPGLWLLDVTNGQLRQLTGVDDVEKRFMRNGDVFTGIDSAPTWQADSSGFYFIRYVHQSGSDYLPYVYHYTVETDAVEEIQALRPAAKFGSSQLRLHPDGEQFVYNIDFTNDKTIFGLWKNTLGSTHRAKPLISAQDSIYVPRTINFSADGTLLLVKNSVDLVDNSFAPENSPVHIVDWATGETVLVNASMPVRYAGWAPQGTALAYIVTDLAVPERAGLYIRRGLGLQSWHVLTGRLIPPSPKQVYPIQWASNNTLLLADAERGFKLVVVTVTIP